MHSPDLAEIGPDLPQSSSNSFLSRPIRLARICPDWPGLARIGPNPWGRIKLGFPSLRIGSNLPEIRSKFARNQGQFQESFLCDSGRIGPDWPGFAPIGPNWIQLITIWYFPGSPNWYIMFDCLHQSIESNYFALGFKTSNSPAGELDAFCGRGYVVIQVQETK